MPYNSIDLEAKERLYREVNQLMVDSGFSPDIPYWRRISDETIACLCIENYNSSFLFYISLGVYLVGLDEGRARKPTLKKLHAHTRLSSLTPVTTSPQIALRGDGVEDSNKTVDEVLVAIKAVGLSILSEFSSVERTKRVLEKYGEMRWWMKPLLKEKLFGSPSVEIRGELPIQEWEIAGSVNPFQKSRS